ncbi:MAG TPA: N-6 DNA methylase, partial [Chthonomonadales bacterium]|nr:N-6 DNA methylase [Chthonomonadales bacterium]
MDSPTRQAIREFCRMARNMLVPAARQQLAASGVASEEHATRLAFAWLTQIAIDPALPQANPYGGEACGSLHIGEAGNYPPPPPGTVEALSRNLQETQVLKMARGNPQILGWLYQYFHASELIPYRGVRAPKVPADKVPIKTQRFTPGWIVEVLLQNTLGRLWLQMHPDSHLRQSLAYLVPLPESAPAAVRPVREIRLLDPACGTMHFGLAAFDLFNALYREELERAGEPGWPAHPSVTNEEEIPASILAHNLFGIDIDPFAIELSTRALRLKAWSIAPDESFPPANLACADVLQRDPLLSNEYISHSYDIIVTNPPYLDRRDYEPEMKRTLEIRCPAGKRNLYAVFLLCCLELLAPGGRLGIITPQTFMFLPSFAELRQSLCSRAAVEMLVHTGLGTFVDAVVDCAFYVLRREEDAERRKEIAGVYFRLLAPRSAEGKQEGFTRAVTALQRGEQPAEVWHTRQSDFDALPGAPWVYWMTPGIRRLFADLPTLSSLAPPRQGLATTDNRRFVRYWWEVGKDRIAFGCRDSTDAK